MRPVRAEEEEMPGGGMAEEAAEGMERSKCVGRILLSHET